MIELFVARDIIVRVCVRFQSRVESFGATVIRSTLFVLNSKMLGATILQYFVDTCGYHRVGNGCSHAK